MNSFEPIRDKLKENRIHGSRMYPVSVYFMEDLQEETILECHWHEEPEFILVTGGRAMFQIGTQAYEVSAGEAVFVNSGEIHTAYQIGEESCSFAATVFGMSLLNSPSYDTVQASYLDPLLGRQVQLPVHLTRNQEWQAEILSLLEQIIHVNEDRGPAFELKTKAYLYLIISLMMEHVDHHPVALAAASDKIERLKAVLGHIHQQYQQPLRLRDLAELINMSEGHFCRFFKSLTQKSPVDYINRYRTQQACRLLETTDRKIVDISLEVGFDSLSYFISVFKQHRGCTPSRYRKQVTTATPALITELMDVNS